MGVAVTAATRRAVRPDGGPDSGPHGPTPAGRGSPAPDVRSAGAADDAIRQSDAYKALSGATYGGGEEAGGLLSKSPWHAGSLLPGTDQASRPSREGTIIGVVIRGETSSDMGGYRPSFPPGSIPQLAMRPPAGAQASGGDATRTQLSPATQRRKR